MPRAWMHGARPWRAGAKPRRLSRRNHLMNPNRLLLRGLRVALPFCALIVPLGCRPSATKAEMRAETSSAMPRVGAESKPKSVGTDPGGVGKGTPIQPAKGHELAAFAGGCFWGVEDTFRQVPGVLATAVGYTGGRTADPTYRDVSSHTTGHAETALVEFDPSIVSYEQLLRVFFDHHDPTTVDRQGPDVGSQYRSAVFTFSGAQKDAARAAIARTEARLGKRVVTEVEDAGPFYKAEEYHQQYDEKTGTHSCPLPVTIR